MAKKTDGRKGHVEITVKDKQTRAIKLGASTQKLGSGVER